MAAVEVPAWDSWSTSHLNIVLLGGRNSGKSSVGNLLLGKEEFVTKERTSCSRRVGPAAGQWLTVVDTPGWWCDFGARDTCELVKREIRSSVSLCPPGPHAFLLAVKASSAFSERRRRAVEEHVGLLGDGAWSHCLVVFTSTEEKSARVETGGKAAGWLAEKCRQRCHGLALGDGVGAAELLEKIHRLVRENGNRVFEMQGDILQTVAEEKRGVEERAQQRLLRAKKHRSALQERSRPITDVRVVLLGAKGSGKTSVLNTILGRDSSQPLRRTVQCAAHKGTVFGREVTVVDTPGWWMNYFCDETSIFDQREMVLSLSLCPPGPHVFLLVVRVDRAFTETYRRATQEHLRLIGEHIWRRAVVVFSVGDWLGGTTAERYIESEGRPLRWLVERCGNRYHVLNNRTKGDGFQVRELIGKIEVMLAEESGLHYYEIERSVAEQLEMKMREESEGVKERLRMKEKQRLKAKSQFEKLNPLPEIRLLLVGAKKTGKSSCGNTILGREFFPTDAKTTSCAEKRRKISGKTVTVVDTPGGFCVPSDLGADPATCAVLLVVNVTSSFKNSQREEMEKQLEAGGAQVWGRTLVLFSHGDFVADGGVERHIESEGAPLRGLVEKSGNRYHVLDNKHVGSGAQVEELIELIEEALVEGRLGGALHGGHRMWKSVSASREEDGDPVTELEQDAQPSCDLAESDTSTTRAAQNCPETTEADGRIVALPARKPLGRNGVTTLDRDKFFSMLASMLSAKEGLRWSAGVQERFAANLPIYISAGGPFGNLRHSCENHTRPMSPSRPTMLVVLPQAQNWLGAEEHVHPLCHPVLRERTLRRLTESGGLQQLIDQWGDCSLEELEAFIDTYFEMVWEQTMGSCQLTEPESALVAEREATVTEAGQEEVLTSIDRKLSKLELLEEIRRDLFQLRESLEQSWKAIQKLTQNSKQEPNES